MILAVVLWINALLACLMTKLLGWSVGIVEAISFTIFVGISVDYALHVDRAFRFACGAVETGRLEQLKTALAEVGAPVAAAAVTTFGAAVLLLFCIILPFRKLGILICAHTALSGLAALVVLPALLAALPAESFSPAIAADDAAPAIELSAVPRAPPLAEVIEADAADAKVLADERDAAAAAKMRRLADEAGDALREDDTWL